MTLRVFRPCPLLAPYVYSGSMFKRSEGRCEYGSIELHIGARSCA